MKNYRFLLGFLSGIIATVVVGTAIAMFVVPTGADNAIEELAQVTSLIVAGDHQRSPEEAYAAQVHRADILTLTVGYAYGEISSDRLKAKLRAAIGKFNSVGFAELAGELNPHAQAVRACIVGDESRTDAQVIACIREALPPAPVRVASS